MAGTGTGIWAAAWWKGNLQSHEAARRPVLLQLGPRACLWSVFMIND